ncbi:hypothetical protein FA13DRAFT_1730396 [Coprinellus micaceus]|uniref:Nephrocystin 3-like N-terminal domain-containing protein n=1 Tax=Coprinellus micaceus TaxID=71717 RepID=A0A4Y7TIL2_COPMI|nr:hypothetical protein FA13DRAFT_1730396 [Coprinellus micaceus]
MLVRHVGTFTQIGRQDIHVNEPTPLKDLYSNIAVGALYNSAERFNAPTCHPDTRKAVQREIHQWMVDGDPNKRILWLTGPAGAGKSAIMGSIAEVLHREGKLGASFFFSSFSGSANRKSKRCFVTTLAYQLQQHAELRARLRKPVMAAIEEDPSIFGKGLKHQMNGLLLEPLRDTCERGSLATPALQIILVDGVDECEGMEQPDSSRPGWQLSMETDQTEVLSVLLQAARDRAFPCRIIVASRPETWIRRFLTGVGPAAPLTTEIFLDEKFYPDQDIDKYLRQEFAELRSWYRSLPPTWPSEQDIKTLVTNASGQFVYPATIIRFVKSVRSKTPQELLEIALEIKPPDASKPFAQLDALYTSILLSSSRPDTTVQWLKAHQILSNRRRNATLDAWFFECLCQSLPGEAEQVLGSLPSLIFRPTPDPRGSQPTAYIFYHKSFLDYLQDPERCVPLPLTDNGTVERWICSRLGIVLKCNGPEVAIDDESLVPQFKEAFLHCWYGFMAGRSIPAELLLPCDVGLWIKYSETLQDASVLKAFQRDMFVMAHANCRPFRPCRHVCQRWRAALSAPSVPQQWRVTDDLSPLAIVLDRFCVNRAQSCRDDYPIA